MASSAYSCSSAASMAGSDDALTPGIRELAAIHVSAARISAWGADTPLQQVGGGSSTIHIPSPPALPMHRRQVYGGGNLGPALLDGQEAMLHGGTPAPKVRPAYSTISTSSSQSCDAIHRG
ncbi:unnamed protein product [Urochloa humidicola]